MTIFTWIWKRIPEIYITTLLVMILFIFCSCGDNSGISQSKYDDIVAKNKLLNKRIEQLKNEMTDDLFGDNNDNDDFKEVDKIKPKNKVVDVIPVKNYTGMGIWNIDRYVDEFGDYTNEYHVRNKDFIKGKFSNSATDGSDLKALLLVSSKEDIAIKLWEYGTNTVKREYEKDSDYNKYEILVKGKNNVIFELKALNSNDRLKFGKEDSLMFHKMLMKGTVVKIRIEQGGVTNSTYNFKFQADGYDNIYNKLMALKGD